MKLLNPAPVFTFFALSFLSQALLAQEPVKIEGRIVDAASGGPVTASGVYAFDHPYNRDPVELFVNGKVRSYVKLNGHALADHRQVVFNFDFELEGSSWLAVRVIEKNRSRFAHTAPAFFNVPGKPLRPRPEEVAYLIKRVEDEIQRHEGVLEEDALGEYRQALRYYESRQRR